MYISQSVPRTFLTPSRNYSPLTEDTQDTFLSDRLWKRGQLIPHTVDLEIDDEILFNMSVDDSDADYDLGRDSDVETRAEEKEDEGEINYVFIRLYVWYPFQVHVQ